MSHKRAALAQLTRQEPLSLTDRFDVQVADKRVQFAEGAMLEKTIRGNLQGLANGG